jgi:hypothetical protein
MSIIGSNILAGASGQAGGAAGYQIERSLRFNAPDSAHLSRTPASAGNRKTWTWAGWVKRCVQLWPLHFLFGAYCNDLLVMNTSHLLLTISFHFSGLYDMPALLFLDARYFCGI